MECYIIGSILQIADVKKAYLYAAAAKMEGLGLFIFLQWCGFWEKDGEGLGL